MSLAIHSTSLARIKINKELDVRFIHKNYLGHLRSCQPESDFYDLP